MIWNPGHNNETAFEGQCAQLEHDGRQADTDRAESLRTLLDAFVAVDNRCASLALNERNDWPRLAETIAEWCKEHSHHIEHYVTTSHGRTYEVWNIPVDHKTISVWPLKIGTLDGKDELRNKIDAIRKDADERIKQLLEVEMAKSAVQP